MKRTVPYAIVMTLALTGCDDPSGPEGPVIWGAVGDIPVPADYDGDGAADFAVYRPAAAAWFLRVDCPGTCDFEPIGVGLPGDVPAPADYSGVGVTRPAGFEQASQARWRIATGTCLVGLPCDQDVVQWGQAGDIPVPADYDGDGADEIAIVRPAEGTWYVSWDNCSWEGGCEEGVFFFGTVGDQPAPADYDGDGDAEMAFLRPETGEWHICPAPGCASPVIIEIDGTADVVVPADYDGDGDDDIAFYTRSGQTWHIAEDGCNPLNCTFRIVQFGTGIVDIPVPEDYDGDGTDDIAVVVPTTNGLTWRVRQP
ncbi:MAG TPA: VCBS repeat-containing protein [Longimicrobiales bacterium]